MKLSMPQAFEMLEASRMVEAYIAKLSSPQLRTIWSTLDIWLQMLAAGCACELQAGPWTAAPANQLPAAIDASAANGVPFQSVINNGLWPSALILVGIVTVAHPSPQKMV
jgi:hypothetical protein